MIRLWSVILSLFISVLFHGERRLTGSPLPSFAVIDTPARAFGMLPSLRIVGASERKVLQGLDLHAHRSYAAWVRALAHQWEGIPYGSGGAGTAPDQLLINLEQMDCMTAVENLMALHRAYRMGASTMEGFVQALLQVRYHASPPCRWEDRYHYLTHAFTGWERVGWGTWLPLGIPDKRPIRYITQHPQKYAGFRDWTYLRQIEQSLSQHPRYYIPSSAIGEWLPALRDGDIIAFVSPEDGLDVSHVGIFFWEGEKATFAHASLIAKKWVYGEDLCAYLDRRGSKVKGITVFRPYE